MLFFVLAEFVPAPISLADPGLGQFSELSTGLVLGSPASRFSLRQGIPLVRSVASLSTKNRFCSFFASALVGAIFWSPYPLTLNRVHESIFSLPSVTGQVSIGF
jgi:hypothetical protein